MAQKIFARILTEGLRKGYVPRMTKQATNWFRTKARAARTTPRQIWDDRKRRKMFNLRRQMIGNLYYFFYEPAGKDTLPYYDTFPLVLPIELTDDGFLGINFHYLDYRTRAVLMDRLMELTRTNDDPADHSEQSVSGKLDWRKLRYDRLRSLGRYKYFRPALKRYKFSHMKSRIIQLDMNEWNTALFLKVERFEGARTSKVWADSRKQIAKGN